MARNEVKLEKMGDFFDVRSSTYDEYMLSHVSDSKFFYKDMAQLIPKSSSINLLDLGCGTGLELEEILKINKSISVTGIDLSSAMLYKLKEKFSEKLYKISLIKKSYFDISYEEQFDVAISVETMHHFEYTEKLVLYKKIIKSLRNKGLYIETDYISNTESEQIKLLKRKQQLVKLKGTNVHFHIDIPFTIDNQLSLLNEAGFKNVYLYKKYRNLYSRKVVFILKNLIFIGGTMGVGKTTVGQYLVEKKLKNAVFLDGDWCWYLNPFIVNEENKVMVRRNICFLLNSFIANSTIENIVFVWVMHQQQIVDDLLKGLNGSFNFYSFSMISSKEALSKRFLIDVKDGVRDLKNLENALDRIDLYKDLNSVKIDVTNLTVEQTAKEIETYINPIDKINTF
ncbi:methyltransferase domain-containing protein [Liquorilactobacillus hordei]|uniref:methyltransferase domain-containing protein n=2 Tax=Liquorilactobacillus hordei TaxID=468911 RepID=UPI001CBD3140|nr:methyltransferase domain-containing protein [Liquorilactobacillus hordei]